MEKAFSSLDISNVLAWTINPHRCNVCFADKSSSKPELHLCSGCRLIRYCGREHQRFDWEIHKNFCTAVKNILKNREISHIMDLEGPVTSWAHFEKALILAKCLLQTILKRQLDQHEIELLTFPPHCQICFQRSDIKTSFTCLNCEAVSYCCQDHQNKDSKNHSKWCLYLKYYYTFYEFKNFKVKLNFEMAPVLKSGNLSADLFSLIETTCQQDETKKIIRAPNSLDEYQQYANVCNFSGVATILRAIHLCNLTVSDNDSLTIYIIGTRNEQEYLQETHCTFLSSQFPTIKEFKFFLVGPELQTSFKSLAFAVKTHGRKTIIDINFVNDTFENFQENITSNVVLESMPHLIVAFNCGFSEYAGTPKDTWKKGIKSLFEFDRLPIVFTSYTKLESRFDLREFSECANQLNRLYQVIENCEENPYKDFRPFRNMELHDRKDLMYFRNGYLNIVIVEPRI